MTQFPPPPEPSRPPSDPFTPPPPAPLPPYSKAAITGFVLSLVGCTAVAAPFGLIFGIVGITKTGGNRLRGRGLAIAAIPISLVSGVAGVFFGLGMAVFASVAIFQVRLPEVLSADAAHVEDAMAVLRDVATKDFNDAVSDEQLTAWLIAVGTKHGKLNGPVPPPVSTAGNLITYTGQFASGSADISLRSGLDGFALKIDDIMVAGSSPRGSP